MYFKGQNIAESENKFIQESSISKTKYDVFIDDNGVEYLFFKYRRYLPDGSLAYNYDKDFFITYDGDFCDVVSPYFEILEETIEPDGDLIQYAGIRLDILMKLDIHN